MGQSYRRVPGVGPITALAFRATIDRADLFQHSRDLGAHLGLTPARYQSGETDILGRISRCGDELARMALACRSCRQGRDRLRRLAFLTPSGGGPSADRKESVRPTERYEI